MQLETQDPRKVARQTVQESIPADLWSKNRSFCEELQGLIMQHRLLSHPLLKALDGQQMTPEVARMFHLEFGHAFAQIFTDSVVRAMFDCSQLEPELRAKGKVSARFLLELNLLDELGFVPGDKGTGSYAGNPLLAHYVQFDQTLKALGVTDQERDRYEPSAAAKAARATFENQYGDYVLLAAVLAVAEQVFTKFAGPWARNTSKSAGLDVSKGYHAIHVEDEHGGFLDDDHSEDSWCLLAQALTPKRYAEVRTKVGEWLNAWAAFCDQVGKTAQELMLKH